MRFNKYYEVSGPRRVVRTDARGMKTERVLPVRIRLETLFHSHAAEFAQRVLREEKIVCEVKPVRR